MLLDGAEDVSSNALVEMFYLFNYYFMEKVSECKLNEMTFHESIDNQFNPPIARYLDYEVIYNKMRIYC